VRRALGVSVGLGMVASVALIVQASSLAALLGGVAAHRDASLARDVMWFCAATALRALAVGLNEPVNARIAAPLRRDLRRRLLDRVMRHGTPDTVDATVQLATTGVDAVESYVANYVPALVLSAMAPLVFLAFLVTRDPISGIIVAVAVGLLPVFMVLLGLAAKDKMDERWRDQQRLAGYFGDVVRGMGVLKAHSRARHALDQLDDVGRALQRITMSTLRVAFLSSFALELLSSLATALVALVLGIRLLDGSLRLTTALAVLLITPEVFLPLRRSAAQYHASADGIAAATTLLDLLGPDDVGRRRATVTPPRVELREVPLRGGGSADRVSAVVPAGLLTVVRGPSGAGKTTLLRTVMGLEPSVRGEVVVDGVDLADLDVMAWRGEIAYLPQDPRLPGSSVREALTFGDATVDEAALLDALARVELDVELDRELGEGANALSAGQRRRLALARCLVRRPSLLVLDEPTAHLDDASDRIVTELIRTLTMTRLVVSHRPFAGDHLIELDPRLVHRG